MRASAAPVAAVRVPRSVVPQGKQQLLSSKSITPKRAVTAHASQTTTEAPPFSRSATTTRVTPEEAQRLITELTALLQESVQVAVDTGPRGFQRSVQALQAILSIAQDYARTGQVEPPEVILRKLFERLGATYIKLGQFVASSPSLFPPEYVTEFQKCLDQTEPVSYERIRKTIEEELSVPIDQAFEYIDPEPLASASIAQVHAARLKGGGKDVVLKVLKPRVEDTLLTDLNFLYLAGKFLQIIQPDLERTSLVGIIEDIRTSMLDEVDFTKEATHVAQFSEFLDSSGMRGVATCPYVYTQYSSKRLLTMERLYGAPLTDLEAIRSVTSGTADPEQTLINALNTWVASVLYCETFHADVHAGNLLVMKDGTVGYLDFGIVGRVSPVTWKAVEALLSAVATDDYRTMAQALATMKATGDEVNIDEFAKDLEKLFVEIRSLDSELDVTASADMSTVSANVTVDNAQINRLLLEIVRVGEVHGIRFPREFGLLVKQVLYFDRYVRLLAPELQVLEDSRVQIGSESSTNGFKTTLDITPNA